MCDPAQEGVGKKKTPEQYSFNSPFTYHYGTELKWVYISKTWKRKSFHPSVLAVDAREV